MPDELARWLVDQGADLSAADENGNTPLHSRAGHWQGRIGILLELGADVNHGDGSVGTPLHKAAAVGNADNVRLLLKHGAQVDMLNRYGLTPLEYALQRCDNPKIRNVAAAAELLLGAGAKKTSKTKEYITRIGTDFEFHRKSYNPESVDATSDALGTLYTLLDVPPVPRRVMHDGRSPIVATMARWEDQHQELWELLVPSRGAAATVQGEVIRISARIHIELKENGGVNWDADFKKMADAFLTHVGTGKALGPSDLDETSRIVAEVKRKRGDTERLCELAVAWVALNPKPVNLPKPSYDR
ncbi:ankyrin repeat domain-containing protein [Labrys wisconsinensis]|uniref:Uncharacterized protein n=1 Tax=Labrys wisconsinensis TaxID=425677 RepID=A0ABU0J9P7_9HYPH|nr:ankyrin repeat domain-containing protein [Labrys wisconsinensis]MDQ0470988.1 hypothetical protein [Labrys wisconsinensis]